MRRDAEREGPTENLDARSTTRLSPAAVNQQRKQQDALSARHKATQMMLTNRSGRMVYTTSWFLLRKTSPLLTFESDLEGKGLWGQPIVCRGCSYRRWPLHAEPRLTRHVFETLHDPSRKTGARVRGRRGRRSKVTIGRRLAGLLLQAASET